MHHPSKSLPSTAPAPASSSALRARNTLLAALLALPSLGAFAQGAASADSAKITDSIVTLDKLEISEKKSSVAPVAVAQQEIAEVAGGASLVDVGQLSLGRVANVGDALRYQPGVFAQSADGGEATKVSIRGSGIIRPATSFNGGVQILFDGEPVSSNSGIPYESFEPLFSSHIEVLRGANAFKYGPLSLGGAINYVTKTGHDASPFEARVEAGSFGYFKAQLSSGYVQGPFDYYASVTRFDQEGYRNSSESDSQRVVFNGGYQINANVSTRVNIRYAEQNQNLPGFIGYNLVKSDPKRRQVPAYVLRRENTGSTTAASHTTVAISPDSKLELGFQYKNYPVDNSLNGPNPNLFEFKDVSGSIRYSHDGTLFGGRESRSYLAFQALKNVDVENRGRNAVGVNTFQTDYDGSDLAFLASNELALTERLWLTTGFALVQQTREAELVFPNTGDFEDTYINFLPRVGFRYEHTPALQFFGNVSRSVEAPTTLNFARSVANIPVGFNNLEEQLATTAEIGVRGEAGIFKWDVSAYYAWVEDELLTVVTQIGPPLVSVTSNAPDTRHRGIESSLETLLWQSSSASSAPDRPGDKLTLRQAYTWNDFYYANNPSLKLPGVPTHLYQADLTFSHRSGFYFGPNLEASIRGYAVDFANSISAPGYTIYGLKAGYNSPGQKWSVFLDARNLSDKRYVTYVTTTANANGNRNQNLFSPGVGRGFSAGLTYRF